MQELLEIDIASRCMEVEADRNQFMHIRP